jgi:hypothetical protein
LAAHAVGHDVEMMFRVNNQAIFVVGPHSLGAVATDVDGEICHRLTYDEQGPFLTPISLAGSILQLFFRFRQGSDLPNLPILVQFGKIIEPD